MHRWLAGLALALVIAAGAPTAPRAEEPAAERARMAEIVAALQVLLPLAVDEARFAAPADRERVVAALRELARASDALRGHGSPSDAGFAYLSRTLASDSGRILRHYEAGRPAAARFHLLELTDACVACHARLPDEKVRTLGLRLVDEPTLTALPAEDRVRLEAATRQFDRALASYEALFADPKVTPSDLDLGGDLDTYLEIAIDVERDPARAARSLRRLSKRSDVPAVLRANLTTWIASLDALTGRKPVAPARELDAARVLLEQAKVRGDSPADRSALVEYIAAAGALNRFVVDGDADLQQLGEAYYLLGLIESRIGRSFWLSQTEHYLEASIRVAPGAQSAEEAYALLEEFVSAGYTGSAGGDVPQDVRERLAELRRLIDDARAGRLGTSAERG